LELILTFKPTPSENPLKLSSPFSSPPQPAGVERSESLDTRRAQLRQDLHTAYQETLALFEGMEPATFCHQAHPDFSPVGWHLGHIAYTEGLWLLEQAAGQPTPFPEYRRLFAADGLPKNQRGNLPGLEATIAYWQAVRSRVLDYLEIAPLQTQEWLWRWVLQHEAQHSETITWVLQLQNREAVWLGQPTMSSAVTLLTGSEMVQVRAGKFVQGCDAMIALDNERPAQEQDLPDYWLDRYPVTRKQYRQFMAAGGYQQSRWWSAAGWAWLQDNPVSQPLYWNSTIADDHPVCGVSWYEADAYARFVGKRLPTEAEWEKAASWHPQTQQQTPYPWGTATPGGQHCNHSHRVGQSTPVNQYPLGASAYGCLDLLGNVWEWTDTWFDSYPGFSSYPYPGYSTPYFDQKHRVLKGGSWATRSAVLRASFRNWYHPGARELFAGFRCASDRPPSNAENTISLPDRAFINLSSQPSTSERLFLESLITERSLSSDANPDGADVIQGLSQTPKTLPPKYFYDDRGSQLFEQICTLPEYYPTRTEAWILQHYAPAIAQLTGNCELVELGSGSSTKTRLLLDAYAANFPQQRYLPIDVSGGILQQSAQALLQDYEHLQIYGLVGTYELALQHLPPRKLPSRMLIFLGSTLGNLNPEECDRFFTQVRAALHPGEFFLLGVDLQKSVAQLEAAYNDSQGVTAEFNLNMLRHLNHRFEGNFNLEQFRHQAFYNATQHQIEMHLESLSEQTVALKALQRSISFQAGETIRTEISRKFNLTQIQQELKAHGLALQQHWTDPNQWFGLLLCQVANLPNGKSTANLE
jgi:gamma-glutamyl hercynylcysteine S-oxide synthase